MPKKGAEESQNFAFWSLHSGEASSA